MKISKNKSSIAVKFDINYEDVVYVDLCMSGWTKSEAAFYAYQLMYEDTDKILNYVRNHVAQYPGITGYEKERKKEEEENSSKRNIIKAKATERAQKENKKIIEAEIERRVAERMEAEFEAEVEKRLSGKKIEIEEGFVDIGDKSTMRAELVRAYNVTKDPKLRLDYAKQLISLDQMQKDQTVEEDTRIRFYLPLTCKKCGLYIMFQEEQKRRIIQKSIDESIQINETDEYNSNAD